MQRNVEALAQLVEDFYTVSSQVRRGALAVVDESHQTEVRPPSKRPFDSYHQFPISSDLLNWRESIRFEEQRPDGLKIDTNVCRPTKRSRSTFGVIRKASQQLYKVLSSAWSCKIHTKHYGSLCLGIEARIRGPQTKIRFTLALIGRKGVTAALEESLWFTVECVILDSGQLVESSGSLADMSDLHMNNIRGRDNKGWMDFTLSVELKNDVLSPLVSSSPVEDAMAASTTSDGSKTNESTNLGDIQDLCQVLRQQRNATHSSWAGLWQQANTLKQIVPQVNGPSQHSRDTTSLDEALSRGNSSRGTLSIKERLRLAKSLAVAVLEFHSTPWLSETWGSGDILFYSVKETEENGLLGIPFLKAPLVEDSRQAELYDGHSEKEKSVLGVLNVCLYNLGIVLLELGFDAPLRSLRRDLDLERGQADQNTDYRTANRLKYLVSKKLGARYGTVVRKCLDCDFDSGYELDDVELQNAVFDHVVKELDRCLKAASIA